ncbi:putative cyclin-A3-1 [Carex littledalei]|uniref:Putative cyclin-A3-1 n=1 Tax=Carex littledalei TaxID=544730 RepID=A0A833VV28_9POAL|nr:putative cyclin-A3-1 [Carex littledalei]
MRGVLIDWLADMAEEYNLVSNTLYLTVSYIDRFLSYNAIKTQRLQLLGATAILIALLKYEDKFPPNVDDCKLLLRPSYDATCSISAASPLPRPSHFLSAPQSASPTPLPLCRIPSPPPSHSTPRDNRALDLRTPSRLSPRLSRLSCIRRITINWTRFEQVCPTLPHA